MRKVYRQIRMLSIITIFIVISFIIHSYFTVAVSSLGKRRYRNIGTHKYLWNRLLGQSVESCLRERRRFWNKVVIDTSHNSSLNCLRRNKNKTGLVSYFVTENFHGIRCLNRTVQLSNNMSQIVLVSYPGSGEIIYRYLIEALFGKRCNNAVMGDCEFGSSKTSVINTHQFADSSKKMSTLKKVILILRNPYDVIIDGFSNAEKTATEERRWFRTKEWTRFVIKTARDWRDHTLSWLNNWTGPLYISYFDDMVSDHYSELYHIVSFLGINATARDVWCAGQSGRYLKGNNHNLLERSVVFSLPLKKIVKHHLNMVQTAKDKRAENYKDVSQHT